MLARHFSTSINTPFLLGFASRIHKVRPQTEQLRSIANLSFRSKSNIHHGRIQVRMSHQQSSAGEGGQFKADIPKQRQDLPGLEKDVCNPQSG